MRIVPMTLDFARDIAGWRYGPPYDTNDMTGTDPDFLVTPESGFFALVDGEGRLIGFRSFGVDGQVPGGTYGDDALDTGGGLRPELTGQGLGRDAIATGLSFGRERFAPPAFRVTIATYNVRARRVCESLGFRHVETFAATTLPMSFDILVRSETMGEC